MISYEEALTHGLEVVSLCTKRFWHSNKEAYGRLQVDEEDLEGHVRHTILVTYYLKHVETNPEFYDKIENFRSSLYTACHRACLAHVRQTKAKKREWMFKPGAAVYLDQAVDGDDDSYTPVIENQLAFEQIESADVFLRKTTDYIMHRFNDFTARIFLLAMSRGLTRKQVELRHPKLDKKAVAEAFENIYTTLKSKTA